MTTIGNGNRTPNLQPLTPAQGPGPAAGPAAPAATGAAAAPTGTAAAPPADRLATGGAPLNLTFSPTPTTAGSAAPALTGPQKAWLGSVNGFQDKVTDILNLNAAGLASGTFPKQGGDISEDQRKRLMSATTDLFKDMPVGLLPADATQRLQNLGLKVTPETKLSELGKAGGDLAKDMADKFKDSNPGAFYGIAAAGAVAVGAYGYTKGSAALEKAGIKPEFDTKVFNDAVTLKAKGSWDARMTNPAVTVGADGTFKINKATVNYGAGITAGGERFNKMGVTSAEARLGVQTDNWGLGGNVSMGTGGSLEGFGVNGNLQGGGTRAFGQANFNGDASLKDASLNLSHQFGGGAVGGQATWGQGGRFESLSGAVSYSRDDFSLHGTVERNFITDRTTGSLAAGYRASKDLDIQLRGTLDSQGNSGVGIGATWRF
jgi:hypothetical protein